MTHKVDVIVSPTLVEVTIDAGPVVVTVAPVDVTVVVEPVDVTVVVESNPIVVGVAAVGVPGPQGPAGVQNLYVQQAAPTFTQNGVWVETNPDDTVKTFWLETGF